jgi:hypothetical protein
MRDRPKLVLVKDCGMNLRPPRTRAALRRVNVRAKPMTRNAGQLLKGKNLLDGDLLAPLRDGLRLDAHPPRQLGAGADLLENEVEGGGIVDGFHGQQPYATGLRVATSGLCGPARRGEYHKRMVDSHSEKPRMVAAATPRIYSDFGKWISDAVAPYGFGAALARYCGVTRPGVTKWQRGSVPDDPAIRRKIAEWMGADYADMRDLIERHEERVAAEKKAAAVAQPDNAARA